MSVLDKKLRKVQSNLTSGKIVSKHAPFYYVKVITGTWNHTTGGEEKAVLMKEVKKYLKEKGWKNESNDEKGVFLV